MRGQGKRTVKAVRWTRWGLVSLTVLIVASLLAPSAGMSDVSHMRLPAVVDTNPVSRLQAMAVAGESSAISPMPTSSGVRVGPNIQVFDNRRPQNEIAIAANPSDAGNLVIGSNDYRLRDIGASVWAGVYTSFDGGRSWTAQLVPGYPGGPKGNLSSFQFGGDPIVGFDRSGSAYAGGIFFRGTSTGADIKDVTIALSRSDDGGQTWRDAVIVAPGKAQSVFNDHPQMTVDATGSAYDGSVYISWTRFTGVGQIDIYVATSRDRGTTWSSSKVSGPTPQGDAQGYYQDSMVTIGPKGEVYAVWDEWFLLNGASPSTKIWMAVSADGGRSFSAPWVAQDGVVPISLPNAPYRHDTYPVAAVDTSTGAYRGRLYLTWPDQRGGNADILLKSSDDGGKSWSDVRRVNDDAGTAAQFMQWVSVAPSGRVDISFYDRRDDPNDYLLNEYYAGSTDGGATFVNVRVSDVSSDPAVWPAFIGDYNQIASTAKAAHPAWTDMRNGMAGDRNQDAYTASVSA